MAYGAQGFSFFAKGYLDDAEKYLLKSMEFCERIRLPSWNGAAKFALGDLYCEKTNLTKSKENFEKAFQCMEDARIMPSIANLAKIGLLRCKVADDERNINLETLFSYSKNNRLKVSEGFHRRWIGEILGNMDGQYLTEAESWINQAIEADSRNGTNLNLARDYLSYADLLTKKGDRLKAKENLGKAIETFKESGADGWVEKAERKLAEIG
jgi:tetratricopeptide (TPR) repeat protein